MSATRWPSLEDQYALVHDAAATVRCGRPAVQQAVFRTLAGGIRNP
jgi:hypothetical protein